jgi:hypothetical protein
MTLRSFLFAALGVGLMASAATPALADWNGHRGWHGGGWHHGWERGPVNYARPGWYGPRAYYYGPRVYYAPPPAYYYGGYYGG